MPLGRRELIKFMGMMVAAASCRVLAAAPGRQEDDPRLVLLVLRGGMDGLSAVPAFGDPQFESARRGLALASPGSARDGALDLDGFFGLHPTLPKLHARWAAGELAVLHAHCIPYQGRSHFDAQNVLEHGGLAPFSLSSGWLNRAIASRGAQPKAIAIAPAMPLVLRGKAPVTSWSPSALPAPEEELLERLQRLYSEDQTLAQAFAQALEINDLAPRQQGALGGRRDFAALAQAAGEFLSAPEGPRVAMLESVGWDTHARQERGGALHGQFRRLDAGLDALRLSLGEAWRHTVVMVLTEFGRTVAMNGTEGTDHGTGGAGFLMGGAVRGRQVVADWPGLSSKSLREGRDLRPTLDTRALIKGVLADHLGLSMRALAEEVFPDTQRLAPVRDLIA
ncbi:MAG: DUF1501 domain-containing protein [Pseudomonadota bacterium]